MCTYSILVPLVYLDDLLVAFHCKLVNMLVLDTKVRSAQVMHSPQ